MMHSPRLYSFVGRDAGPWRIERIEVVRGEGLPWAARLDILNGAHSHSAARWRLRGVVSNQRYTTTEEQQLLTATQQSLGKEEARCAALIPIRKTAAWWALPQDERRRIFEERSAHVQIGLRYSSAIARRLHHCRDLAEAEPFDFLTWFEYPPEQQPAFEQLLADLRATEEWQYVDREIDIRLSK